MSVENRGPLARGGHGVGHAPARVAAALRPPALRAAVFFIAPVLRAAFAVDLRTAVAARLAGALRAVDLRVVVLRVVVLRVAVLRVADLRAGDLRAEAFRAVVLRALEDLRAAVFRPAALRAAPFRAVDFLAVDFRAVDFRAPVAFLAVDLRAVVLRVDFFAVDFFVADFLVAFLDAFLAAVLRLSAADSYFAYALAAVSLRLAWVTVFLTALLAFFAVLRAVAAAPLAVDAITLPMLPAVSFMLSAAFDRLAVTPLPLLIVLPSSGALLHVVLVTGAGRSGKIRAKTTPGPIPARCYTSINALHT